MGKIDKWGNSLGLRIPSTIAKQMGLGPGVPVDVDYVDGKLVISKKDTLTMEGLVSRITPENLQREMLNDDNQDAQGKEVW